MILAWPNHPHRLRTRSVIASAAPYLAMRRWELALKSGAAFCGRVSHCRNFPWRSTRNRRSSLTSKRHTTGRPSGYTLSELRTKLFAGHPVDTYGARRVSVTFSAADAAVIAYARLLWV